VNDRKRTAENRTAALSWEDLRYFLVLAQQGTLSGTARALRVNHATVARHIARLEETLSQLLFDRHAEGYALTAAGEAVLAEVAVMRDAADAVLNRTAGGDGGLVRLTATRTLADSWLVEHLPSLRQRHPGICLEVLTESRNMSLARREADVAIRLAQPLDGDVIARPVATIGYRFFASPALRDAVLDGTPPSFIGFDNAAVPEAAWLNRHAAGRPFAFRSNSPLAQRAAAVAGYGVALLPCYLAAGAPGLVPVDLGEPPPAREAWLLVRRDLARLPRVRAVTAWLSDIFAAGAPLFSGVDDRQ
jgi:DNA-binding transcriptional LysR family regulator